MSNEITIVCRSKASADGKGISLTLWNHNNGTHIKSFISGLCARGTVVATKHFLVAAQADKACIFFWKWTEEKTMLNISVESRVSALQVTSDGLYCIVGTIRGVLFVWEISTGRLLCRVNRAHSTRVSQLRLTSDNQFLVSGGSGGVLRVWSLAKLVSSPNEHQLHRLVKHTPTPLFTLRGHTNSITCVAVSKGVSGTTRIFSGSNDKSIHIWEMVTGSLLGTITLSSEATCLCVDPAEVYLYVGLKNGKVVVHSLHDQKLEGNSGVLVTKPTRQIAAHSRAVSSIAVTTDARTLLTCGEDAALRVWDAFSLQAIRTKATGADDEVNDITIIPKLFHTAPSQGFPVKNFKRKQVEKSDDGLSGDNDGSAFVMLCNHEKRSEEEWEDKIVNVVSDTIAIKNASHDGKRRGSEGDTSDTSSLPQKTKKAKKAKAKTK
eukprot:m.9081 g.9081  ORF g.9081 m.9081 type:complete len:435 (-) comp6267_c0_seq1:32-1336(-)